MANGFINPTPFARFLYSGGGSLFPCIQHIGRSLITSEPVNRRTDQPARIRGARSRFVARGLLLRPPQESHGHPAQ